MKTLKKDRKAAKPIKPAEVVGLHNHPVTNDGPDETPVYEDLYHDEGRRNILEEEEGDQPRARKKAR